MKAAGMAKYLRLARLPQNSRHRAIVRLAARALRDDAGGEVLEYALVAGLIVVGSISAIACVGTKVFARWSSINTDL